MSRPERIAPAALAVLLAVAGSPGAQEEAHALEQALARTVRAIEVVADLERDLENDPEEALRSLLALTEAPSGSEDELAERVAVLEDELVALRATVDVEEAPVERGIDASPPAASTGLDESVIALLRDDAATSEETQAPLRRPIPPAPAPEPALRGYTADALGQAKACYLAGRVEEALQLLADRRDPESRTWYARCLLRVDRDSEAIAVLTALVAEAGDSPRGRRASQELEFARWKESFGARIATAAATAAREDRR